MLPGGRKFSLIRVNLRQHHISSDVVGLPVHDTRQLLNCRIIVLLSRVEQRQIIMCLAEKWIVSQSEQILRDRVINLTSLGQRETMIKEQSFAAWPAVTKLPFGRG